MLEEVEINKIDRKFRFLEKLNGKFVFDEGKVCLVVEEFGEAEILIEKNVEVLVCGIFVIGEEFKKKSLKVILNDEGARFKMVGVIVGISDKKHLYEIEVRALAANTEGKVLINSVLFDKSFSDCRGNLIIEKGAFGADLFWSNQNLLMNEGATAVTFPGLEIMENDVRAKHSASVGQIDEESVFYLESRGISKSEARKLIAEGSLHELLNEIDHKEVKEFLFNEINKYILAYEKTEIAN